MTKVLDRAEVKRRMLAGRSRFLHFTAKNDSMLVADAVSVALACVEEARREAEADERAMVIATDKNESNAYSRGLEDGRREGAAEMLKEWGHVQNCDCERDFVRWRTAQYSMRSEEKEYTPGVRDSRCAPLLNAAAEGKGESHE